MNRPSATPLPVGYEAQSTLEFRDPSGRFSYEFTNVYAPAQRERRGLVCRLDQGRSFWSVVAQVDETGVDQLAERSVSYAQARKRRGNLSFSHFASEMFMRKELAALL